MFNLIHFFLFFMGYVITAKAAVPCDERCQTCSNGECTECKDGFYIQYNKCESCDPSCKTCETMSNKCSSCGDGKYLDEKEFLCIDCLEHCKECTHPRYCEKCYDGYYGEESISDSCKQCPIGCGTCFFDYFDYLPYCTSCAPGYRQESYINEEYGYIKCQECQNGCLKCSTSADVCDECGPGTIQDGTSCLPCAEGCTSCKDTTTNCQSCKQKYYKKDNQCLKCMDNCDICNDATFCTSCSAGFFSDNGKCVKCDTSCSHCHDDTNNCDKCMEGYHFNIFNQCVKCESNCNECNSTHCLICNSGYYADSQGKCQKCNDNCQDCTGPTANDCLICPDGSYLSKSLQKCFKCHESCATCTGPYNSDCKQCAEGYFSTSDGTATTCQLCEVGCLKCTSELQCENCADGFYMTNSNPDQPGSTDNDCKMCSVGCKKCNESSCFECLDGFFDSSTNGQIDCKHCPSNCKKCALKGNDLICSDCIDGYFLNNGKCNQCKSPCATCSTAENKCKSCLNGYLLVGESCDTECAQLCETCEGKADHCTSCISGYVLIDNMCRRCQEGCKTCSFYEGSSSCTSCLDGYALDINTNKCEKCHSSCATCYAPHEEHMCLDCPLGSFKYEQYSDAYPFYIGKCKSCKADSGGVKNCAECTSDCTDEIWCNIKCTRCDEGYFLNGQSCGKCDETCENCFGSGPTECYICAEGYQRVGDKCENCPSSCFGCKDGKCTSCVPGKYLEDGTCKDCEDPCEECVDRPTKCTTCKEGFAYNGKCYPNCVQIGLGFGTDDGKTCHECKLDNCIEYDDSCQCQKCIDGFGAVTDPKTKIEVCVQCSLTNCKNCTGSEKEECTECMPGYYMYTDEDGKNKVCTGCRVENCQTCATGGLSCDVCIDKYYLDTAGKCQPCTTPNCAKCSGTNGQTCDQCESGYLIQSGKCVQCTSPCATCEESLDHCLSCVDGFVIVPGKAKCRTNETAGSNCVVGESCNVVNPDEEEYFEYEVPQEKYETVKNEEGNGGALHVINCIFYAKKTEFNDCQSVKGGGGGIYISNKIEGQSSLVDIDSVKFNSCSAQFGGGLYVFCPDEKSPVKVKNCEFVKCQVPAKTSDQRFFGGSAIYLTVANGNVEACTFRNNKGPGSQIKVTEDFSSSPDSLRILNSNSNFTSVSVSINQCNFESSDGSIFYSNRYKKSNIEVKNCEFKGVLTKGAHFIDGNSIEIQISNLNIKNCRFESDLKSAINSKSIKVDFTNNEVKSSSFKLETKVFIGMTSAALVAIVAITVTIIKRINSYSGDDNNSEIHNA